MTPWVRVAVAAVAAASPGLRGAGVAKAQVAVAGVVLAVNQVLASDEDDKMGSGFRAHLYSR